LSATKTGEASLVSDLNSLETSIKRLLAMLESVGTYVDDVAVRFLSYFIVAVAFSHQARMTK
jgi:hypothetical protein